MVLREKDQQINELLGDGRGTRHHFPALVILPEGPHNPQGIKPRAAGLRWGRVGGIDDPRGDQSRGRDVGVVLRPFFVVFVIVFEFRAGE